MTDIRTSWIFGYHGYSDIIDIRTSRIFGHHGNLDIMHTRTSWIFRHHGYMDIRDIQMSWIFGCLDIVDILGDTPFSGKSVFPEKKYLKHCQCKVVQYCQTLHLKHWRCRFQEDISLFFLSLEHVMSAQNWLDVLKGRQKITTMEKKHQKKLLQFSEASLHSSMVFHTSNKIPHQGD